ncbi:MAG TPA: PRC-barrel domain-containing protein [Methylomirabilota bacterium]|nr:PRC-barrel domain-containing protein [Methylomirabilota bacterium]
MKKAPFVVTAALLSLGLATGAWAQTTTSPAGDTKAKRDAGTSSSSEPERTTWSPQATALESSKLIGMKIRSTDGKDVGQVDQVIVNQSDGKITHVILSKGGVLGMGGEKLVLMWPDVKIQHDNDNPDRWVGVVDQAKVDRAPKYEARKEGESLPAASPSTTPSTSGRPAKKR